MKQYKIYQLSFNEYSLEVYEDYDWKFNMKIETKATLESVCEMLGHLGYELIEEL